MTRTSLVAAALAVVVGAGVVSNPPPGALLGVLVPVWVWGVLVASAVGGAVAVLVWREGPRAWVGVAALVPLLVGPVHAFGSRGFFAQVVGGVGLVLVAELASSANRLRAWRERLDDAASLEAYRSAYERAFAKLVVVVSMGAGAALGLLWVLRAWGPSAFALSLEASRPEGLAGVLVALGVLVVGLGLTVGDLARSRVREGSS